MFGVCVTGEMRFGKGDEAGYAALAREFVPNLADRA